MLISGNRDIRLGESPAAACSNDSGYDGSDRGIDEHP